jgi:NAD(P)-dependent dehydrogenase (short-subunit alcohol dehydrogenase family)
MNFDDLQFKERYSGTQAYNQSKLANLLFTYELSRRLADTHATVNAVHPGFAHTHLGKQNKLVRPVMELLHSIFAKIPEKGAETPLYLAAAPEVEGVTGEYFIRKESVRSSEESYDTEAA